MALDDNSFSIFLNTMKKFVDNKLIPREDEVVETNTIPNDIVEEMKNIGLFGISIPTEYGGSNLSMEQEVKLTFELGRASPAFRSMAGTNIGIGSQTIVMSGTAEQKNKYLPKFSTGEIIGSFALTEPDSGSDAMSIKTTAKKNGNKYVKIDSVYSRPTDVDELRGDSSKAKRELNWKPRTNFKELVSEMMSSDLKSLD